MALLQDMPRVEAEPRTETTAETTAEVWAQTWARTGAEPAAGAGEAPQPSRGKLLAGLFVLLAVGIGAVGLVLTLAPWANAVGSCGGG